MAFDNQTYAIFVQLTLATLFGMILGIERLLIGSTAGPRTYGLVSLGAALITILSQNLKPLYPDLNGLNPAVMISAIITGIGFIGAGLIVFRDARVSGLTTAAGIWVSSIIGITIGFGFYVIAFFATFLTLFIFTIMWHIERKIEKVFAANDPEHTFGGGTATDREHIE
jgi:putative Mg2+ transporter-C (MgtC) family protein